MKRYTVLICVLALFNCNAFGAIKQGDYDYDFNFRWSSEGSSAATGDKDVFEVGAGIAKQVTRRIQLGIGVGHESRENSVLEDTVNYIDLKIRYHIFPDKLWVPYVGGIYRWYDRDLTSTVGSIDASDTATGLLLGARREITKHNDIYIEFQHLDYGNEWPVDNLEDGNKVLIGLIHQIR